MFEVLLHITKHGQTIMQHVTITSTHTLPCVLPYIFYQFSMAWGYLQ